MKYKEYELYEYLRTKTLGIVLINDEITLNQKYKTLNYKKSKELISQLVIKEYLTVYL